MGVYPALLLLSAKLMYALWRTFLGYLLFLQGLRSRWFPFRQVNMVCQDVLILGRITCMIDILNGNVIGIAWSGSHCRVSKIFMLVNIYLACSNMSTSCSTSSEDGTTVQAYISIQASALGLLHASWFNRQFNPSQQPNKRLILAVWREVATAFVTWFQILFSWPRVLQQINSNEVLALADYRSAPQSCLEASLRDTPEIFGVFESTRCDIAVPKWKH